MRILSQFKKIIRIFIAYLIAISCIIFTKLTMYVYIAELISLIPFRTGDLARYYFYKKTLFKCGENVTINFGSIISNPKSTLGNNIWIGTYNIFGTVDIGDWVITAQGCHIPSGANGHGFERIDIPIMKQQGLSKTVVLKKDIWLGANVTVLNDIGEGCVIGAGSVVTKSIPDWSVAVGCPAKVIKNRKKIL